jgi:hypothetical protein
VCVCVCVCGSFKCFHPATFFDDGQKWAQKVFPAVCVLCTNDPNP